MRASPDTQCAVRAAMQGAEGGSVMGLLIILGVVLVFAIDKHEENQRKDQRHAQLLEAIRAGRN